MRFSPGYAAWTIALLAIEVVIALYVHDDFVRPYLGDVLVVILLYCAIASCLQLPKGRLLAGVLAFACLLEVAQYFQLVSRLGLQHNTLLRTVIGTTFSWSDLAAYAAGTLIAGSIEALRTRR